MFLLLNKSMEKWTIPSTYGTMECSQRQLRTSSITSKNPKTRIRMLLSLSTDNLIMTGCKISTRSQTTQRFLISVQVNPFLSQKIFSLSSFRKTYMKLRLPQSPETGFYLWKGIQKIRSLIAFSSRILQWSFLKGLFKNSQK